MLQIEKLNKCLNKIGSFSSEELILIYESAELRKFKKNEVLLNIGQVCNSFFLYYRVLAINTKWMISKKKLLIYLLNVIAL